VFKPSGEAHRGIQGSCPYGIKFDKLCPRLRTCSTGACIKNLTAEELFVQIEKIYEPRA
jgi:heptosyltransferase I